MKDLTRADVRRMLRMAENMIVRGELDGVDDSTKMQLLNLKLENGYRPSKVEHWHPYGFTYHPQNGAEVLALSLRGNRDHMVVLPGADRRYRLKGLEQGELAVHDDQGQKVHFKRDSVWAESGQKVVAKAPRVNLGDDTNVHQVLTTAGPSSIVYAKV